MGRNIEIDARRGGGAPHEILFGEVTIQATALHHDGTKTVFPDDTTVGISNGVAVLENVDVSPAGPEPAWAYRMTFRNSQTGRGWSELVGVPAGSGAVKYPALTRFTTTMPPETTKAELQNWVATTEAAKNTAVQAAATATAPTDAMVAGKINDPASLTGSALFAAIDGSIAPGGAARATLDAAVVDSLGSGNIPEVKVGPKLSMTFDDGNAGQRVSLTGTDETVMPYYQVVASTRTGTDGGKAVAGYQLHLGPDDGGGINREFFYIEAVGELHPAGPHYRIGTWGSGTGEYRPLRIESEGQAAFIFDRRVNAIQMFKRLQAFTSASLIVDTESEVGSQTGLRTVVYSNTTAHTPATFLGHAGGTKAAPVAPVVGSVLGSYQFGSMNGTTQVPTAQVRALPDEAWTFGSAQGTRIEFLLHLKGATSSTEVMRLNDPAASQAGMSVIVNRAGVKTLSPVWIGAPDSAGTGYRELRVTN